MLNDRFVAVLDDGEWTMDKPHDASMQLLAKARKIINERPFTKAHAVELEEIQSMAVGEEADQIEELWAYAYAIADEITLRHLCDEDEIF